MDRDEQLNVVRELLAEGLAVGANTVPMMIRGACMAPSIQDGRRISVRAARVFLPGDVVVFRTSTDFAAHRVLGYRVAGGRVGLVTRGDRCSRHDGLITLDRVVGQAEVNVPAAARVRAMVSFVRLVIAKVVGRA